MDPREDQKRAAAQAAALLVQDGMKVGLGTGTTSAYGRPGDYYRYYEINPLVLRLAHSEFTFIDESGRVLSKPQFIGGFTSGALNFRSASVTGVQTRIYGDAAVVTGKAHTKGTENGKPNDEEARFTDTWVKRDGRWVCAATHDIGIEFSEENRTFIHKIDPRIDGADDVGVLD